MVIMNDAMKSAIQKIEFFDQSVHQRLVHHRLSYTDQFFAAITGLGSMYISSFVLILVYMLKPVFIPFVLPGFIILVSLVFALKEFFERDKPEDSPLTVDLTKSFPSGHSAVSVFMAVSFSSLLPEISFILYIAASLICISRVYLGAHYPSDVLAGATMGAAVALIL